MTPNDRQRLAPHFRIPARGVRILAKAGYAARGLVYLIIGLMTVLAAFGASQSPDTRGALRQLLDQPFGTVIVWVMIVSLFGYALWRAIQSLLDTDDHGLDPKGMAIRVALLVSAGTYITLAIYCLAMVGVFAGNGGEGGGGGGVSRFLTGIVGARYVALALAAIFLGVATAHVWKAVRRKYEEHFWASDGAMRIIHPVSIIGLTARGLVFAVIAVLLFYRFLTAENGGDSPPDIQDALRFVQDLPFGQALLAALGLGLIAFSTYSFIEAVWRRINVRDGFD